MICGHCKQIRKRYVFYIFFCVSKIRQSEIPCIGGKVFSKADCRKNRVCENRENKMRISFE